MLAKRRTMLRTFKTLVCLLALLVPAAAWAQAEADQNADPNANPVSVRLEIFIVSRVGGNETFQEAATARPGQTVEYRLFANNDGDTTLPPGTVVVSGPVPEGTTYVANSATPTSDDVLTEFSVDGETFGDGDAPLFKTVAGARQPAAPSDYSVVRWTLLTPFEPGQEAPFVYRVTVNGD